LPDALIRDIASAASPTVEGDDPSILDRIAEKGVALAIWTRPAPPGVAAWLDRLPPDRLPDGRFVAEPGGIPERLAILCDLVGLDDSSVRKRLIDDIAGLANVFARLSGAARVDLRLEAIDHDGCWRFHRDHVGLRLNATYRGPATQWPPLDQAARALRAQRRYRGPLNELPRFSAALFKGVKRAGASAVVHRSPPVAVCGQTRLFLCLNEEERDD
jgi:hypothetical protein